MYEKDQDLMVDPVLGTSDEGLEMKKKHTERMKEIVEEVGWPSISKIGVRPSSEAWFLVHHSDQDVEFQKEVLELLKKLPEDEVKKVNIAMLEDRVRKNQGIPQLYGTAWKFDPETEKQIPYPIEDPEHVDERRKKMGLDSMEENRQRLEEWEGMLNIMKENIKSTKK